MALADYSLCVVRNKSGNLVFGVIQGEGKTENYSRNRKTGMEFEPDWTRHILSSALKTQVISTAISWARKIPINEGYHEFL
ncbi:hypothetical protein QVD17_31621 [Tagetes erecta]|uniref:Uncharacterized protein n=1 Tax=Tagetes erecta TaxID=13708 RepID=A0AAD8NPH7_TARER|nr:hypothetical protein QVD17_31621 [Tagetes erecta]